ncbi:MAG TPA: hypothetical protein VLR46_12170, partial [Candidatus Dormibacteraeota bacterium]|nr:hypothetical protein [Candidatus Dormibacteraeota bacterium]
AATVAAVEAVKDDDHVKNALCPVVVWSGNTADLLGLAYAGMTGLVARAEDPALTTWNDNFRLNPARGAVERLDDQRVVDAFTSLMTNTGPALANMARLGAGGAAGG